MTKTKQSPRFRARELHALYTPAALMRDGWQGALVFSQA